MSWKTIDTYPYGLQDPWDKHIFLSDGVEIFKGWGFSEASGIRFYNERRQLVSTPTHWRILTLPDHVRAQSTHAGQVVDSSMSQNQAQ